MPQNRRVLVLAGFILLSVCVGVWLVLFPARDGVKKMPEEDTDSSSPVDKPPPTEPIKLSAKLQTGAPAVTVPQGNAADLYRQAFALINALADTDRTMVTDWKATVDPAVAAELCARLKPICALAHGAAADTNCDWNLSNVTLELPQPYLPSSRLLAQVLVWSAAHCRTDDDAGISDDLAAAVRLGQTLVKPPLLGSHLLDLSIQTLVIEFLAAHAFTLPGETTVRLAQLLADDQSVNALADSWKADAAAFNASADKLAVLSPVDGKVAVQKLVSMFPNPYTQAESVDALRLVAELETEYARALTAPDPEYQTWLARFKTDQQANPMMKLLLPGSEAMDDALDKTQALTVKRALLLAGLAYLRGEPDALANHRDPSSGDAFVLRQTESGFELQSAYRVNAAPLTMVFPKL